VHDADAKHPEVGVGSETRPDSRVVEEPATGGDAAPAEAAARIDAGHEAQPAEDATDPSARETSKG